MILQLSIKIHQITIVIRCIWFSGFLIIYFTLNPFVPNALFLYPLKTSENYAVFWCFQGVRKGALEKWINYWKLKKLPILTHFNPVLNHIETSHLVCIANQTTGFYMKCNTRLKKVKLKTCSEGTSIVFDPVESFPLCISLMLL